MVRGILRCAVMANCNMPWFAGHDGPFSERAGIVAFNDLFNRSNALALSGYMRARNADMEPCQEIDILD